MKLAFVAGGTEFVPLVKYRDYYELLTARPKTLAEDAEKQLALVVTVLQRTDPRVKADDLLELAPAAYRGVFDEILALLQSAPVKAEE